MKHKRSSRAALLLAAGLTGLAGCASSEPAPAQSEATPVRETQNPEAPPYSNPRPKIRPKDVVSPDSEE